jgi:SAM-dependent methyltransferase
MIELIDPREIEKEKEVMEDLKQAGIDHFDVARPLGWNYILDHVWLYSNIKEYLENQGIETPMILDVGCGNSPFHCFVENNLNVDIIGIDRPQGYCHQEQLKNADYLVDFLKFEEFKAGSVDLVYWLSAIEHNRPDAIRKLYQKSISLLKPGGLLLVTFAVSRETCWFEDSQQSNLSLKDSREIFEDNEIKGDFDVIHNEFRDNILLLRDKYQVRYGSFDEQAPDFIVGGLRQVKK